jgi:histone H3
LQKSAKAYLVGIFQDTNWCAIHGKKITITPKDIQIAQHLRSKKSKSLEN